MPIPVVPVNINEPIGKAPPKVPKIPLGWASVSQSTDISKRCAFDANLDCGNNGDFAPTIATVTKGDRVQLLSPKTRMPNGTDAYKIKFQQWDGWTDADYLSLDAEGGKR